MTTMNGFGTVFGVIALLALGGCETMGGPSSPGSATQGSAYSGFGVVHSIELVQQAAAGSTGIGGSGVGVGTVAGAVVGGVLGHQVGSGRGQTIATVAGAAGGAYVGHQIESGQKQQSADAYRFTVRMDSGSFQTLMQDTNAGLRVGDRVRIDNGVMQRY
jgi:outer membrane lipoprotein SlyB